MESESTLTNTSIMAQLATSQAETQPLLSPISAPTLQERIAQASILPRHLCLPSKAAVLILVWSGIVGAAYTLSMDATVAVGVALNVNEGKYLHHFDNVIIVNILIPYLCLAVVMLLYPLSGFMADIYCGRYKCVMLSLCILTCSLACFTVVCTIEVIINKDTALGIDTHSQAYTVGKYIFIGICATAFISFVIGLSGFQANFIQLGLDQLHEAPSEYLGLFVHWAIWAGGISAPGFHILFASYGCTQSDQVLYVLYSLPPLFFMFILTLLVFSCCKYRWFYVEPAQHNPYKTVFKVLNFARKHKYPYRRSAFAFGDRVRPTRIDFAKERFGGPFKTEQVEDVKTFFRILTVLLAVGPIYILEVPASYFIFPLFTLHTGLGPKFKDHDCTARWLVVESGTLGYLISVIMFPLYIWLIYSVLRRCIPRIFIRLFLGGLLLFLTVIFMLVTDLVGHLQFEQNDVNVQNHNESMEAGTYCMLRVNISSSDAKALNLPWGVHLVPNVFISLSPMLVTATAFEFISAQGPHSMKGLLVGTLFTVKGIFQLSSAFLLLPFSLPNYWAKKSPRELNCGFGYLSIVGGLALIGLVLFLVRAKKYQYRERDDPPFDQTVVEEVFARNIDQNTHQEYRPEDQNNVMYTNIGTI